jgi:hypothetical protein
MDKSQIFSKGLIASVNKATEAAASKGEGRINALCNLGGLVKAAKEAFQAFKAERPAEAKGLKQADVLEALFGFGKMQQSRLERAAEVSEDTKTAFFAACRADSKLSLSIEGLLKFAENSAKADGEEGEEGEEQAAPEAKPLLSISARLEDAELGKNFSLRIMADGSVKTTARAVDVRAAIALLEAALKGFPEGETEAE